MDICPYEVCLVIEMRGMIAFASLLLLFAGAFADGNATNATKPDVLGLKYGLIECRINSLISLVEYGQENANVSGGDEIASTLSGDLTTLKAYADSKDRKGFNDFMKDALRNDMRNAVLYLKDVKRGSMRGNRGNNSNASSTKDYFDLVVKERAECLQGVALEFAKKQVDEIEGRVNDMNKTIGALRNKSVNTTKMEMVEKEAEENLDELKDAVEGGNVSEIQEKVKELREEHLHIWARFQIEKLEAILDTVDEDAISKGYSSDVDAITALIDGAESKVQVGSAYEPSEFEQVKSDLRNAHMKLRNLIMKLRGA